MAGKVIDMEMNKDGVYEPQKEARTGLWIAGSVAVLGAVLAALRGHIREEHRDLARGKLAQLRDFAE